MPTRLRVVGPSVYDLVNYLEEHGYSVVEAGQVSWLRGYIIIEEPYEEVGILKGLGINDGTRIMEVIDDAQTT